MAKINGLHKLSGRHDQDYQAGFSKSSNFSLFLLMKSSSLALPLKST